MKFLSKKNKDVSAIKKTPAKNLALSCLIPFLISFSGLTSASQLSISKSVTPAQSLLPMLGGLLGILCVIFVLAYIFRKFTRFNFSDGRIKIVETQSLGTKEKLVIVEIQNRQLVLGVTPHTINSICELEQPIERSKPIASFESMMKKFLQPSSMLLKKTDRSNGVN